MTNTATQEQFILDAKGKKTGIVLSLSRYRKLMEDLHDLAIIAERRDEEPISLEEMRRRLKDGRKSDCQSDPQVAAYHNKSRRVR